MHISSYNKMSAFASQLANARGQEALHIVDLGSQDVNGCYKPLFENNLWHYTGVDLAPGKNVDVVLNHPYDWSPIQSDSVDVVISGQAFEHIEYIWQAMLEVERVLKPNGVCCIIAPAGGFEHRYPVDCWRLYPDGMRALAKFAGLEVVSAETEWTPTQYADGSEIWKDTVLIAKKTARRWPARLKHWVLRSALRHLSPA